MLVAFHEPYQDHDASGMEKGCCGLNRALEIPGQSAIAVDPGGCALDRPTPRRDLKADLIGDFPDDLNGNKRGNQP